MADQRPSGVMRIVTVMLVVGAASCAGLALSTGQVWLLLGALLAVCGFGVGWEWPGLVLYEVARQESQAVGTATGYVQIGASLGGLMGPVGVGWVLQ